MGVQTFHAVQCFSCSTFQVQQVKKIPKFVCASCGEKQSVRTVYGTSAMAKEIRLLVQNLNTARGAAETAQEKAYEECTEQDDPGFRDNDRQGFALNEKTARAIAWKDFVRPEDTEGRQLLGSTADVPDEEYVLALPERPLKRQKQAASHKESLKAQAKGNGTGPSHSAVLGRGTWACNPSQQPLRGMPPTSTRDAAPAMPSSLPRPNPLHPNPQSCPLTSGMVPHFTSGTTSGHAGQFPSPHALEPWQTHWASKVQSTPAAVVASQGQVECGLHEAVRRKAGLAVDNMQTTVMSRHECNVAWGPAMEMGAIVETGNARVSSIEALPAACGCGASMDNPYGSAAQPIAAATWPRQESIPSIAPHNERRALSTAPAAAAAGAVQGSRWAVFAPPAASFTADDHGTAELNKWHSCAHNSGNVARQDPDEPMKAGDVQEHAWAGKKLYSCQGSGMGGEATTGRAGRWAVAGRQTLEGGEEDMMDVVTALD